jgi:hypothetical protein
MRSFPHEIIRDILAKLWLLGGKGGRFYEEENITDSMNITIDTIKLSKLYKEQGLLVPLNGVKTPTPNFYNGLNLISSFLTKF